MSLRTVVLTLTLGLLTATGHAQGPARVGVDMVRSEPLAQTVPVIGRVVAVREGGVAARINAPVAEVLADVGERVEAGQVLLRLDPAVFELERDAAASRLTEAQLRVETDLARLELARLARVRLERLSRTRATAKAESDDARQNERVRAAEVSQARAAVAQARVPIEQAELSLRYTEVYAPYAGVVSERLVDVGEFVRAGDELLQLVGDEQLEVEANVPFERLAGLADGASVRVLLDDGSEHTATVRSIVPRENPRTRTRPVRFVPAFGETRVGLASDQSATVLVPAGEPRDVLTVHKDAITRRGAQALVYVVAEGKANPRPVQLGQPVAGRFEVLGGLGPGDLVVIRGNERLRPGTAVSYEEPRGGGASAPSSDSDKPAAPAESSGARTSDASGAPRAADGTPASTTSDS